MQMNFVVSTIDRHMNDVRRQQTAHFGYGVEEPPAFCARTHAAMTFQSCLIGISDFAAKLRRILLLRHRFRTDVRRQSDGPSRSSQLRSPVSREARDSHTSQRTVVRIL